MDVQGFSQLILEKLTGWAETAIAGLPNFVVALAVALVFALLARWVSKLTGRVAEQVSETQAITRLAAAVVKYAVIGIGLVIALGILGLQKTVLSLLAGAGVVGLAIGFAFQDLAANFIAGIVMGIRKPFEIGDVVQTTDYMGTVKEINLRNTLIETFDGQLVLIPNRQVFENPLTNFSRLGTRRVDLEVGVGYDTELAKAATVAKQAIESLDFLAPDKDVDVVAKEFGGSSINFSVRYWIPYPGDVPYPAAVHEGVLAIKRVFDDHEIDIPFPIRTLDFSMSELDKARFVADGSRAQGAMA